MPFIFAILISMKANKIDDFFVTDLTRLCSSA